MPVSDEYKRFTIGLLKCKTIAIAGLEKNTGKTTTLNFLLNIMQSDYVGLTSIGRDGEDKDIVTFTEKPRIYIGRGTVIATARQSLLKSDSTFEILEVFNVNTPLGEIIIARALTAGFVELAGPSTKAGIKEIVHKLKSYGAEVILVDGALSRKSFAAPEVTDGCILCTGAAYSEDADILAEETELYVNLLSTEEVDEQIKELFNNTMDKARLAFVYKNSIKVSKIDTAIGAAKDVIENAKEDLKYVFVKGIITDNFMKDILNSSFPVNKVIFAVEDGTKLFIKKDSYERFLDKGGSLKVINKINVLGISVNPTSPSSVVLDYEEIKLKLKEKIELPIINVMTEDI